MATPEGSASDDRTFHLSIGPGGCFLGKKQNVKVPPPVMHPARPRRRRRRAVAAANDNGDADNAAGPLIEAESTKTPTKISRAYRTGGRGRPHKPTMGGASVDGGEADQRADRAARRAARRAVLQASNPEMVEDELAESGDSDASNKYETKIN
eukprot:CAMPEP_0114487176 /NCGR_PEP_ID=MMETSP0109-20121206/623_1 /TAXON_ID=29199 /ORGANISM="Chlorarachnion reptans, Strain CCCM449" /LENGTH=152 /DNA_ID=CAMNT_0001663417 /DNA_START=101 /DNA_END=559 /DNA_ORIENTATION=-